jgi:drug/metabolite transporter (DMT)-like permease
VPRAVLLGVALAIAGTLAITGVDAARSGRALLGDLLSLASAVAATGYLIGGRRVMRETSTAVYTMLAYGACALVLLPVALAGHTALWGFSGRAWVELGVIALAAQVLGHTMLNVALPVVGTTAVALAILLETPGAALVAWAWLGQTPPLTVVPGTVLMLAGLVVVARSGSSDPAPLATE